MLHVRSNTLLGVTHHPLAAVVSPLAQLCVDAGPAVRRRPDRHRQEWRDWVVKVADADEDQ